MAWDYKVVGAPEKGAKKKGAKTGSDRVAAAFEAVLAEHAADGWEYVRTDQVPVVEKPSLFSKPQTMQRAVMVFRREKKSARTPVAALDEPLKLEPKQRRREPEARKPEPAPEREARPESRPEPEIRLAHSSDGSDLKRDLTD